MAKEKLSLEEAKGLTKGASMKSSGDVASSGRKKLAPEDSATVKVTVYFTPKEKAIIEKLRGRMSESAFCVTTMTQTGIFNKAE